MKTIETTVFKANCIAIIAAVQAKSETVVITKRGKPLAKLVLVSANAREIYNFLAGKGSVAGDVVSPVISGKPWFGRARHAVPLQMRRLANTRRRKERK